MSKDKYSHIFLHQIGAIVSMNSLLCKYFATCMKKRLRTAYCIQCGMFSFETVLWYDLMHKKKISILL